MVCQTRAACRVLIFLSQATSTFLQTDYQPHSTINPTHTPQNISNCLASPHSCLHEWMVWYFIAIPIVSPVQSIEPHRILAPTRDLNREPLGPQSRVVTTILPLHTIYFINISKLSTLPQLRRRTRTRRARWSFSRRDRCCANRQAVSTFSPPGDRTRTPSRTMNSAIQKQNNFKYFIPGKLQTSKNRNKEVERGASKHNSTWFHNG